MNRCDVIDLLEDKYGINKDNLTKRELAIIGVCTGNYTSKDETELNLHLVSKCCDEHIEERDLYVDPSDGRMFCNQCGKTLNAEIMNMKRDKVKFNVC